MGNCKKIGDRLPNALMVKSSQHGYSIIELLVTLAVAGIILGISIPGLRSFGRSSGLKDTAVEITTDLWLARQKSIATSSPHSVRFDSNQNQYTVFIDDGAGNPSNLANGIIDADEQIIFTRRLEDQYQFALIDLDPDNVVIFMPKGSLKEGTTGGQIRIRNDKGETTVLVRQSGLCKIK